MDKQKEVIRVNEAEINKQTDREIDREREREREGRTLPMQLTYTIYNADLIQFLTYFVTFTKKDSLSTHTPKTVTSRKNITTADRLIATKKGHTQWKRM